MSVCFSSLQVAFAHLFFNLTGILLFYPIPQLRRLPLSGARYLGQTTAKYRWFAIFYLLTVFFILPGVVFALSLAGWQVLVGVTSPFILLIIVIVTLSAMQRRCPERLPEKYRTWLWLPRCLRSWEPYDEKICQLKMVWKNMSWRRLTGHRMKVSNIVPGTDSQFMRANSGVLLLQHRTGNVSTIISSTSSANDL